MSFTSNEHKTCLKLFCLGPGDPNNVLPTKRKRKTKAEQDLADYDDDFIDDEEEDAFATDEDEDFELDDSDSD